MSAWEEALASARTDPATARQLLGLLTGGCHTLDGFEKERASLYEEGIPAEFLPGARELGRLDLIRPLFPFHGSGTARPTACS
ncbi:hypothetical protein [Embleya sp. NPDC005575]|uniref:hypothetical protein n=1 Tax=Embleya sp. NPDC005575 TaxID=3156892 RepID=UPI00339F43CD